MDLTSAGDNPLETIFQPRAVAVDDSGAIPEWLFLLFRVLLLRRINLPPLALSTLDNDIASLKRIISDWPVMQVQDRAFAKSSAREMLPSKACEKCSKELGEAIFIGKNIQLAVPPTF